MALVLVDVHVFYMKPKTKRADVKQSYLQEERAKKTSDPTTQTDADFKPRRDPVIPKRRHLCYSRAIIAIITSQAALVGIMKQIPLSTREGKMGPSCVRARDFPH